MLVELPPLSAEDCQGLRASIAVSGVVVPIVVWPKGKITYIVDGSHRKKIADELGYECPELVRSDLTEEEARIMARALNLARRQLDREQKRQIIADQLHETPERSARWIAKMLGVSDHTVRTVRDELRSGAQIAHLDKIVGQDGRCYPSIRTDDQATERYTPPDLMTAVRRALGRIDLDPASSREANKTVEATSFFNKRMDGLKQRWHGRVFLNPPFNDWPNWMSKLDQEIKSGRVKQAVVVGPANISAFRPLLLRGGLLLVPTERPKFHDPTTDRLVDPPFGSLICYVGPERERFVEVFGEQGLILRQV
jgi:ParB-like chromosome segregation protein Spo0J